VGEESEALKAEIERRRAAMSKTIDAIGDKVVPSRVIAQRRAAVSGWVGERSRPVAGTVVGGVAVLLAVSLFLVLRSRTNGA
jgi:hypothetical protein